MAPEEVPRTVDSIRSAFDEVASLPLPVIAVIDGVALGGGFELALACDIRIVCEYEPLLYCYSISFISLRLHFSISAPTSKIGLVETKIAIIPGAGGSQRLPRLVGPAVAKELIFTAKILNGNEAHKLGLANHVVDQPFEKAKEVAREILSKVSTFVHVLTLLGPGGYSRGQDGRRPRHRNRPPHWTDH